MEPGARIAVTDDRYGRYIGEEGTVVPQPEEITVMYKRLGMADDPAVIWVRLDGMDERIPAVGFDPSEIQPA